MPRRPAAVVTTPRAMYKGRAVGALVPKITRKVFEKFGFSTATLLTDWTTIVGAGLAEYTQPERLKWPRGFEGAPAAEAETGRPGATLMLRVEPARALDVQYKTRLICDRINAYFGYRAVAEIRLVQAPLSRKEAVSQPARAKPQPRPDFKPTDNDELNSALRDLEASIRAERPSRPR